MDYGDESDPLLPRTTNTVRGRELNLFVEHDYTPLPDDLADVVPTMGTGSCIDIPSYLPIDVQVDFVDLEGRIFEKHQSRGGGKAKQRIIDGKVQISVSSAQTQQDISRISVWVRREPKAAAACEDRNGEVELNAVCLEKRLTHYLYQVDLDSVYDGPERPVYQLARVEMEERNKFQLLVQVHHFRCPSSDITISKPFLIRTQKKDVEPEPRLRVKRPHNTWSHISRKRAAVEPPSNASPVDNPDSTTNSPFSAASSVSAVTRIPEPLFVQHLEAQRANITHLQCSTLKTTRGDIAYHMRLTDPEMCQNLQEGVVVGFFPDSEGQTQIAPLTSGNSDEAVMAGVISRSAYIHAHEPPLKDEGKTDIVCVIGMVKVQVKGTVKVGERIYTSANEAGTAIPESHLPLGAFMTRCHTLLGMAMEGCKPSRLDEANLVNCFVCIVLGINDKQLTTEVENILDSMEMDIKAALNRFKKTTWKRIICLVLAVVVFLSLLEFILYEFIAPGTWLRYYLCKRGSIPGHTLSFDSTNGDERCPVHGVEFKFEDIKKKFEPNRNISRQSKDARYFLNLDRCAWGGKRDRSDLPGHGDPVCGGRVLAVNASCSGTVYQYKQGQWNNWRKQGKNINIFKLKCEPPTWHEK